MGLWTRTTATVIALVAAPGVLAEQCVLQDRTVSQSRVVIAERGPVRKDVVPNADGQRRCVVDFRVRVGSTWHTAFGEYVWDGHQPSNEACAVAVSRAEDAVRQRVGRQDTVSERVLVCKDRPELRELRTTSPGTLGEMSQFRPHPNYPNDFYHKGARCRWFLDVAFTGNDLEQFQGIICEVQDDRWVVVDKF